MKRAHTHNHIATTFALVLALGIVALFSGCASAPQPAKVDFATPAMNPYPAQTVPASAASSGSLFQSATYRLSFEDRRARQVGDTVTIRIVENVQASQSSNSSLNRSSSISGSVTAIPGVPEGSSLFGKLGIGADNQTDFTGKGGTSAANTFTGSITTTVAEVLPNGYLVVVGEKQIGLNQNVDVMRFTGTIDPLSIQAGNIVDSTAVANVRVESKGRGAQYEVQTVGWLTRFFHTLSPF